jgi:hypothetical protein
MKGVTVVHAGGVTPSGGESKPASLRAATRPAVT